MVTDVSPLQLENAELPIEVTKSGIVTDVSPLHPENAPLPILVIPLGILNVVKSLSMSLITSSFPPEPATFTVTLEKPS